jgi:hypothetical protein
LTWFVIGMSCGGSAPPGPTIPGPGPAPTPAPPQTQPVDPFAYLNAEGLRVVVVVVRADHPEDAFLESQNTYPMPSERRLDLLAHTVGDCVHASLLDDAMRPQTFGRRIGDLTFTIMPERDRSEVLSMESTFEQTAFNGCVRDAISSTTIAENELAEIDAPLVTRPHLRVKIGVTHENRYYVREVAVKHVVSADMIDFREDDPRLPRIHPVRRLRVTGIRFCEDNPTYVAHLLPDEGRALLEIDPEAQHTEFDNWHEAYVRLPDGHDYGLELIKAGVCDAAPAHPRSAIYPPSTPRAQ